MKACLVIFEETSKVVYQYGHFLVQKYLDDAIVVVQLDSCCSNF